MTDKKPSWEGFDMPSREAFCGWLIGTIVVGIIGAEVVHHEVEGDD